MRYFFITFVTFLLFTITSFAESMALVFKSDLCSGAELCVHGQFKTGQKVILLSKVSEKTCTAITDEAFTAEDEMVKFAATKLTNLEGCESVLNPFLAIFETKVKYARPKLEPLSTTDLDSLDKKVKSSSAFSKVYQKSQISNYEKKQGKSYAHFSFEQLKKLAANGTRSTFTSGKTLSLLWHKIASGGSADGVIFAIYQDQVYQVSSLFKFEEPLVFLLNNQIYIFSSKSCQLGCGEVTHEIYKLSDDGVSKVYTNSDFST